MLSDRLIELDRNLVELTSSYPNASTSTEVRSEWANRLRTTKTEIKQRASGDESTGDDIKDRCMALGIYLPSRFQALKGFIEAINTTPEPLAYVGQVYSEGHREVNLGHVGRLVVLDNEAPRVVTNPDKNDWSDSRYLYLNILGGQVPLHLPMFMISQNFPNPFANHSIGITEEEEREFRQVLDAQETENFIKFGVDESEPEHVYYQGNWRTYCDPFILFGDRIRKLGVWKALPVAHSFGTETLIRFGEYLQGNGLSIRSFDLPSDLRRRVLLESADAAVSLVKSSGALLTDGRRANEVKGGIYDSMQPEPESPFSIELPQRPDYEHGIIAYRMLKQELAKAKGEYDYAQRRVSALEVQLAQILQAVHLAPNMG